MGEEGGKSKLCTKLAGSAILHVHLRFQIRYLSGVGKLNSVLVDDAAKVHEQPLPEVAPVT